MTVYFLYVVFLFVLFIYSINLIEPHCTEYKASFQILRIQRNKGAALLICLGSNYSLCLDPPVSPLLLAHFYSLSLDRDHICYLETSAFSHMISQVGQRNLSPSS